MTRRCHVAGVQNSIHDLPLCCRLTRIGRLGTRRIALVQVDRTEPSRRHKQQRANTRKSNLLGFVHAGSYNRSRECHMPGILLGHNKRFANMPPSSHVLNLYLFITMRLFLACLRRQKDTLKQFEVDCCPEANVGLDCLSCLITA